MKVTSINCVLLSEATVPPVWFVEAFMLILMEYDDVENANNTQCKRINKKYCGSILKFTQLKRGFGGENFKRINNVRVELFFLFLILS